MQKRIVITGANGQLGQTLVRSALAETQVLLPLGRDELDITDAVAVSAVLDALAPDIVINAAAYTAVDAAETHREQAFDINALGVRNLAAWVARERAAKRTARTPREGAAREETAKEGAARTKAAEEAAGKVAEDTDAHGPHLIHVSTDFVFGGDTNRPCRTDDPTAPLGIYGQSKLAGEQRLADLLPGSAAVVRTAWLYSPYQNNFVKTMLRLMAERDALNVVDDQVGTPCSTATLVQCLQAIVAHNCPPGIYHCTDAGVASWYDFAVAIQEEALALALLDRAIPIRPISTEHYPTPARRPAYSVLDKRSTVEALGLAQVHWRVALRDVLRQISEH